MALLYILKATKLDKLLVNQILFPLKKLACMTLEKLPPIF